MGPHKMVDLGSIKARSNERPAEGSAGGYLLRASPASGYGKGSAEVANNKLATCMCTLRPTFGREGFWDPFGLVRYLSLGIQPLTRGGNSGELGAAAKA